MEQGFAKENFGRMTTRQLQAMARTTGTCPLSGPSAMITKNKQ